MLFILGLGIYAQAHVSAEVQSIIEHADHVYYLLNDDNAKAWINERNSNTTDLSIYYKPKLNRRHIYTAIVQHVIDHLVPDEQVCMVFYGHPSVFVDPGLEMVRQARAKGIPAKLLPAISADACLYADLEFDPSISGCQMYEASDFLHRDLRWDVTANLILWQIGVVNHATSSEDEVDSSGIRLLVQKLLQSYQPDHEVTIYEAAFRIFQQPRIEHIPLKELDRARLTSISTLHIPPQV